MNVIVTDSSACLTRQEARQLGVVYVPLSYTADGVLHQEGFSDAAAPKPAPGLPGPETYTSQPAPGLYQRTFAALRKAGFGILCLTLSSRLSGTYSNACLCAKDDPDIRVVDTRTAASGIAFLAFEARRLMQKGLSLIETAEAVQKMRSRVGTVFTVRDMDPLRRSGRLGPVRQSVMSVLNMRPILSCRDGALVSDGSAYGYTDQLKRLFRSVPDGARHIAVQYTGEESAARELADMLRERHGMGVVLRKLGPVLGVHLGTTAFGVVWFSAV